jgi:endonuclease III
MTLTTIVEKLAAYYGKPARPKITDPFELILWELSAELASDEKRGAAFDALKKRIGVKPQQILKAAPMKLVEITKLGGMEPERRARRMVDAAALAAEMDLREVLKLPLKDAKKTLRKFPSVGEPMAEKILMLTRSYPVLSLESNGLRVLQRLGFAEARKDYTASYRAMQDALAPQLPPDYPTLIAAHQLLRRHGRELCRTARPLCPQCPLERDCPTARRSANMSA